VVIESQSGRGTAVHVDLPVAEQAPPDLDQGAQAVPPGAGQHVLIVEDDDAVRRIAERILRRNGYVVTSVSGGVMALEELAAPSARIDALLTDVVMPEMTGLDLVERARKIHPGLAVVVMSGYTESLFSPGSIPDIAVVQKPFSEASLTDALRSALHPA
jgi:CheY-like chemotaxis protein